jgi:serine/threonine protein kinase
MICFISVVRMNHQVFHEIQMLQVVRGHPHIIEFERVDLGLLDETNTFLATPSAAARPHALFAVSHDPAFAPPRATPASSVSLPPPPRQQRVVSMAVELCPNGSLQQLIERGPLAEPLAKYFFRQLAHAVAHCHQVSAQTRISIALVTEV